MLNDKKIVCYNLVDDEIKLLRRTLQGVTIKENKHLSTIKTKKLIKLLDLLKYNDSLEANKNVASYLDISVRTLNRYINHLLDKGLIIGEKSRFKDGGRGYIIQGIISKKETKQKKI